MTKPSHAIPVRNYHLILVWPLLLRGEPPGDGPLLRRWVKTFADGGWRADVPPAAGGGTVHPTPATYGYEEVVYFHPFVRDFLYGDGKTEPKDRSVHHLAFDRATSVRVTFTSFRSSPRQEDVTLRLAVGRVELYLCKPNVALFVVEVGSPVRLRGGVDSPDPVTLAQVLDFQDQFRRIYPPFWYDSAAAGGAATQPGLCPTAVEWLADPAGPPLVPHDCTAPAETFKDFTRAGAEPPVFAHWRYFFGPVKPLRTRHDLDGKSGALCYQQIMDERIPAMAYVGVDDPRELSEGDTDRLTFFDAAGTDDYPYQREFLAARRAGYTYDRFWHYDTRYLCSGYGFAVLGRAGAEFFDAIVLGHFRAHYLRLGLVAHFLRAALLGFADQLAESIKELHGKGDADAELGKPGFRRRVQEIQFAFLKFRSRAWFPEVTNQLQGAELHELWFRHLNIGVLFDQVNETSERLHEVLTEYEARQLSRSQERLSVVAGWFLPLSVVFSFLSVLFAGDFLPKHLGAAGFDSPPTLALVTGLGFVVALVVGWLLYRRQSDRAGDD